MAYFPEIKPIIFELTPAPISNPSLPDPFKKMSESQFNEFVKHKPAREVVLYIKGSLNGADAEKALSDLAIHLAKTGRKKESLEVSKEIKNVDVKFSCFRKMSSEEVDELNFSALSIGSPLMARRDKKQVSFASDSVLDQFYEKGLEESQKLLAEADFETKVEAWKVLFNELITTGQNEEALHFAESEGEESLYRLGLYLIASKMMKEVDKVLAKMEGQKFEAKLRKLHSTHYYNEASKALSEKNFSKAIENVDRIEDEASYNQHVKALFEEFFKACPQDAFEFSYRLKKKEVAVSILKGILIDHAN